MKETITTFLSIGKDHPCWLAKVYIIWTKKRFIREFNDINLLSMSVFLKLCQIRGHKSTIAYCELTSIKTECCFHLMVIFIYNIYLWILVSTLLCITIYLLFPLLIHGVFHFANALQTSFHCNEKRMHLNTMSTSKKYIYVCNSVFTVPLHIIFICNPTL